MGGGIGSVYLAPAGEVERISEPVLDAAEDVRKSPGFQFFTGLLVGGGAGSAPGGFVLGPAADLSGYDENLPPAFWMGFGLGEAAWGAAELITGGAAIVGGGSLTVGSAGTGSPAGVPVFAGGLALAGEGLADIGFGLTTFMVAVSRGMGGGKPGGGGGTRADHPNHVADLPFGYKEKPFRRFVARADEEFAAAGFDDAELFMQGSSVSRVKYATKEVLDARAGIKPSDYDVAVVSPKLVARAEELGLDIHKGPLTAEQVSALGLREAQESLTKASKGGRPVNFKVYETVEDVYEYAKTTPFSLFAE